MPLTLASIVMSNFSSQDRAERSYNNHPFSIIRLIGLRDVL